MNKSYLEYYKTILTKVKFDEQLTNKEYKKALKHLPLSERVEFVNWAKQHVFTKLNAG